MRLGTSLRSRAPLETEAVAAPLLPRLGITRVVDATALDRLGLPVCFSLRPGGRTLDIHSGKGLSRADAHVGAVMEAVEYGVAEAASEKAKSKRMSIESLVAQLPGGLRFADLAPRIGSAESAVDRLLAVPCEDLRTGATTWLPAELALVPCPSDGAEPLFGWSTNGLASGNTRDEATLHGLLEVLERDTLALHMARDASCLLDPSRLPPPFAALASSWQRLGIELIVRWVPNELSLPCFDVAIHEPSSQELRLAHGSGLHFDRDIALARAICEAAQSRVTLLYRGRRQQLEGEALLSPPSARAQRERHERVLIRMADDKRRAGFDDVPHRSCRSIARALTALRLEMEPAGLEHVFRYEMPVRADLHVVKMIVARSESNLGRVPRIGPRLLARMQGR